MTTREMLLAGAYASLGGMLLEAVRDDRSIVRVIERARLMMGSFSKADSDEMLALLDGWDLATAVALHGSSDSSTDRSNGHGQSP